MKEGWYPKSMTSSLLSVVIAILSGISINLLTSSLPTNQVLFWLFLLATACFIISVLSFYNILKIRNLIDIRLSDINIDNESSLINTKDKASKECLWLEAINMEKHQKLKFKFWKMTGILAITFGLILIFIVKLAIRNENIISEDKVNINSLTVIDALDAIKMEMEQDQKLIINLTDSLKLLKQEVQSISSRNAYEVNTANKSK